MKPVKIFGAVAVVMSVILGGALYWLVTNDSKAASELYFQILCASAGVLLIAGFGMLIMSKKKPDAFEETFRTLTNKEILNVADALKVSESAGDGERSIPSGKSLHQGGVTNPAPDLTFEREMALRKKQYYESANVPAKEEPEKIHLPQKSISLTPPASAKPEPEKIKIKFEFPFGKKEKTEKDPLRQMLADEEKKEDKVTTWKLH